MVKLAELGKTLKDTLTFVKGQPYPGWEKPAEDNDSSLLIPNGNLLSESRAKPPKREKIESLKGGGWVETDEFEKEIFHQPEPEFAKTL